MIVLCTKNAKVSFSMQIALSLSLSLRLCVCMSAYLTQAIHLTYFKSSINARNECERGKKKKTQPNKQINKTNLFL